MSSYIRQGVEYSILFRKSRGGEAELGGFGRWSKQESLCGAEGRGGIPPAAVDRDLRCHELLSKENLQLVSAFPGGGEDPFTLFFLFSFFFI